MGFEINHDFHIHTERSLCAQRDAFAKDYIREAKALGLKKLGFADHFWDDAYKPLDIEFYGPQNYDHVASIRDEIKSVDTEGIKIYVGCEAEYSHEHGVGITEACAERFDFIIVPNSHTHKTMPAGFIKPNKMQKHVDFMIRAYYDILNSSVSKYILSMAHPFEAVSCPYDNNLLKQMISDDTYRRMFDATAEKGIAIEINTAGFLNESLATVRETENFRILRLAKECGCKFTFGSDAHSIEMLKELFVPTANMVAEALGLTENDLHEFVK